jgi:hypothetical protein
LLLRRDLHALFDLWLLAIDASDWTVQVAPRLRAYAWIAEFHGRPLDMKRELRPKRRIPQNPPGLCSRRVGTSTLHQHVGRRHGAAEGGGGPGGGRCVSRC